MPTLALDPFRRHLMVTREKFGKNTHFPTEYVDRLVSLNIERICVNYKFAHKLLILEKTPYV